jgi:hypothetical protein
MIICKTDKANLFLYRLLAQRVIQSILGVFRLQISNCKMGQHTSVHPLSQPTTSWYLKLPSSWNVFENHVNQKKDHVLSGQSVFDQHGRFFRKS